MSESGAMTRTPVRKRLLAAADELFYAEGVQTVGIDAIVQRAGASKKSLYAIFGSKEALIGAYLNGRREDIQNRLSHGRARLDTRSERLLGIFDLLGEWFATPGYNRCPLLATSAEAAPGSLIKRVHTDYRAWVHALFADLAIQAELAEPAVVTRQLHLLYDAASVAAKTDADPTAAVTARAAASAIITSHTPKRETP